MVTELSAGMPESVALIVNWMSFLRGFAMRLVFAYSIPVHSPMENPGIGVAIEYRMLAFLSLSKSVAFTTTISTSSVEDFSAKRDFFIIHSLVMFHIFTHPCIWLRIFTW